MLAQRGQDVIPGRVTWHTGAEVAVEITPGLRIGHPFAPSMLGERITGAPRPVLARGLFVPDPGCDGAALAGLPR